MAESFAMNGGDGLNSYTQNSKPQEKGFDEAKALLSNSIHESLSICTRPVFTIADMGCSVGPNTFTCVQTILEAVKVKFKTQGLDETQLPEFHVFFNDHVDNDFNTLFKALPVDRTYMAAGVPGSFHGRLFPKASMNLIHTAFSAHWLSRVPEEVTKEGSPAWNKGRITCVDSSKEVGEAYAAQFQLDMEAFFAARSEELADDGLLVVLIPCRPESTLPSASLVSHSLECLGNALQDMAKEGLVSEYLVDTFNLPFYIPSPSEVKQAVLGMNKLMSIEKSEELYYPPSKYDTPEAFRATVLVIRAVTEVIVCKHFGSELDTDELFNRFAHKLEEFLKTPRFEKGFNEAKALLSNSIHESLSICTQPVFTIADMGCSVGPNTFTCVQSILEAVKLKFKTQGLDETQLPEFHVFFNDHVDNDFNTLFKALPVDRTYMAAGVPGSFQGRLFPKGSMNLIHTAFSAHWLSRVPEEVTKEGSPAWNKGRITCGDSSKEVGEAYAAQFQLDMEAFFAARSEELADDGLLVILIPCRPESTLPSASLALHSFECLGNALQDMAKEGLVSEYLVDTFNLPFYIPSPSEVKQAVLGMNKLMSIEKSEELYYPPSKLDTPEAYRAAMLVIRAVTEVIVCKHFGSELDNDELFNRFAHKLEGFSKTPRFVSTVRLENLYLLVKRNAVSNV